MRTIIAGGRDYALTVTDYTKLDALPITSVISGGASGADHCGELWAKNNRLPLTRFLADWKRHGRAAGPIRNQEMARHADAVVLFPGGAGTRNMKKEALAAGLKIYDYSI